MFPHYLLCEDVFEGNSGKSIWLSVAYLNAFIPYLTKWNPVLLCVLSEGGGGGGEEEGGAKQCT